MLAMCTLTQAQGRLWTSEAQDKDMVMNEDRGKSCWMNIITFIQGQQEAFRDPLSSSPISPCVIGLHLALLYYCTPLNPGSQEMSGIFSAVFDKASEKDGGEEEVKVLDE